MALFVYLPFYLICIFLGSDVLGLKSHHMWGGRKSFTWTVMSALWHIECTLTAVTVPPGKSASWHSHTTVANVKDTSWHFVWMEILKSWKTSKGLCFWDDLHANWNRKGRKADTPTNNYLSSIWQRTHWELLQALAITIFKYLAAFLCHCFKWSRNVLDIRLLIL